MFPRHSLLAGLVLGFALACGGGSGSGSSPAAPAKGLSYQDPAGTGWRLVKDPASTSTHLLLDLVGPSGLKTRGAGFNLQGSGSVRFRAFDETGCPIRDLGVYDLKSTDATGDPLEPVLLAAGVKKGNLLTAAVFQKDRRATAKDSGAPLFQIAVELDSAAGAQAGDSLPISITKAQYMAEDIGAFATSATEEMAAKAHLVPMTITVGALHAE
jgi:hypothetical protein